jgi:hypothetical protein
MLFYVVGSIALGLGLLLLPFELYDGYKVYKTMQLSLLPTASLKLIAWGLFTATWQLWLPLVTR